jgi:hypothetical protein
MKDENNFLEELIVDGKKVSSVLPADKKNYLIDIDGTICEDVPNSDPERMKTCTPYTDSKETLNSWYDEGHIITFFTSRTSEDHEEITRKWLDDNGFKYHHLLMNKPRGGNYHWIDNSIVRATRYNGKWTTLTNKEKTIEVFED